MLILTRRMGERLRIGDDVSVTVMGIYGHQVRIGIEARRSIAVHREEIFNRIVEENTRPARRLRSHAQMNGRTVNWDKSETLDRHRRCPP